MNMCTDPANKWWNQHVFVFSCVCSGCRFVFQGIFWAIEHCTRNIPTGAISKLYSCTWLGYNYDKPLKQSVQLKVGVFCVFFLSLSPHTHTHFLISPTHTLSKHKPFFLLFFSSWFILHNHSLVSAMQSGKWQKQNHTHSIKRASLLPP